jgi:aminoglycoside phosphotransferase family enzyme/adenylate kinase family enzyme
MAERDGLMLAQLADEPYAAVSETHSAVVFFAGDRAYKLKKPVSLGFVDFSTPEARAAACQRETELNRRFASDVYLGVAEVRDPAGQVCDHLVAMRRMPASRRLSALIQAGEPVSAAVRQVARILAAWHASAPRGPVISEQGSRDALWRRWEDNIEQIRPLQGEMLGVADVDEVQRLAGRFLAGRAPLFDARIRGGRVLDGHGDLLAEDIFCLPDGPRILDCLEFDDRLRWVDGLDDAAFLAMDLERLGAGELAERFTGWYIEYSGDSAPVSLRHHYTAYRAFVRAKVSCLRCSQGDPAAGGQARQLAALALRHLHAGAVTLVLIGGLPGTGKSALADVLAGRLGFTVLNSDRIRKELAGIPAEQKAPAPYQAGIYDRSWTERTYQELLHRAAELLSHGESVIADASWIAADHRAAAAAVTDGTAADIIELHCAAPAQLAADRMSSRTGSVSDASPAVAERMAQEQAPWPQAITIDTSGPEPPGSATSAEPVRRALEAIRPHEPEHLWRPTRPYMLPG